MEKSLRSDFDRVDHTSDPETFVRYLDTTRATAFFQEIKQRSYALLALGAGDHVCDVGCGTGEDVLALARLVAPGGRALGVDASVTMLAEAVRRAATTGIVAEFAPMDVQRLNLPKAQFDGVRAERLLQHVPDPDAALSEIVRVAKPGGRIVIWEADLDLFVLDAPDYQTSRAVQRYICDNFRNGGIGHELYRRFKQLGLLDVQATPLIHEVTDLGLIESAFDLETMAQRAVAARVIAPQRAMDWLASLADACDAGRFFCAIGGFLAFGRKPI
ncbi:MAG TPA: methyltransferase domain-containing protein [Ktedonobacterales bacterium]|nr:methyltransferase domain-containing protein [Ktedonobacterales bacterium]